MDVFYELAWRVELSLSVRFGFYWCPWGPLQDQNTLFPIAVYQQMVMSAAYT